MSIAVFQFSVMSCVLVLSKVVDLFIYFAFGDNVTHQGKKPIQLSTFLKSFFLLCLRRNPILKNNLFNLQRIIHRLEHHLHTTNLIKALNRLLPAVSIKVFWSLSAVEMDIYSTLCIFKLYTFGYPKT